MNIKTEIKNSTEDMVRWRQHIHENPETAYKEINTSTTNGNIVFKTGIKWGCL